MWKRVINFGCFIAKINFDKSVGICWESSYYYQIMNLVDWLAKVQAVKYTKLKTLLVKLVPTDAMYSMNFQWSKGWLSCWSKAHPLHTQTFRVLSHSKGHEPVFKSWKDHLWKVNVVTLHTISPKEPWNCSFFLFVEQRPNLFNFGSSFTQIPNTEIIYGIILSWLRKVFRLRIHCLLPLKEIRKV